MPALQDGAGIIMLMGGASPTNPQHKVLDTTPLRPYTPPMNNTPLTAGTLLHHNHFGRGRVVSVYMDHNVGDMVDVHWLDKNEILDHREENLRYGLTSITPPAKNRDIIWAELFAEG